MQNTLKRNLLIPSIKLLVDIVAVEAAFLLSYLLRFHSPLTAVFPVTKGFPAFENYLFASLILLPIYIVLFGSFNSYRTRYYSTFTQEVPAIIKTAFLGILFAMSAAFLYRGFSYSRLTFLLLLVNTIVIVMIGRYLFHRIRRLFIRKGFGSTRTLVVGSAPLIPRFLSRLEKDVNRNFEVIGYCADEQADGVHIPWCGAVETVQSQIDDLKPEALLFTFSIEEHPRVFAIMKNTEGKNIELFYIPDLLDIFTSRTTAVEVAGVPLLRLKTVAFSGWQGFLKRGFDILISFVSIVLLSPFLALMAVLVKTGSAGPVFYRQKRVGLDGKEFTMLKFRSMRQDAEEKTGPVWAQANDPRVTPLGSFLRRSSLDELPQLFNVLAGDMSLVGPRPERKFFVDQFQQEIPKYAERHRVRSGMTGWAQVNGQRGQSPIEDRTRFDVYYIENWSLGFDIKIILMTFMAIIRGENAY